MKRLQKSTQAASVTSLLLGTLFFLAISCSQEGSSFNIDDDNPISFVGLAEEEENEYLSGGDSSSQMTTGSNQSISSFRSLMSMSSVGSMMSNAFYYGSMPFWYGWKQGSRLVRSISWGKKYEDFGSEVAPSPYRFIGDALSEEDIELRNRKISDIKWYNAMKGGEYGERPMLHKYDEHRFNEHRKKEIFERVGRGLMLRSQSDEAFYKKWQQEILKKMVLSQDLSDQDRELYKYWTRCVIAKTSNAKPLYGHDKTFYDNLILIEQGKLKFHFSEN